MKFDEAMALVREGKPIERAAWAPDADPERPTSEVGYLVCRALVPVRIADRFPGVEVFSVIYAPQHRGDWKHRDWGAYLGGRPGCEDVEADDWRVFEFPAGAPPFDELHRTWRPA